MNSTGINCHANSLTSCVVKQIRLQRFGARRRLWDGTVALQNINPPSPPASHFYIVINTL